jgi:hypothetical protein
MLVRNHRKDTSINNTQPLDTIYAQPCIYYTARLLRKHSIRTGGMPYCDCRVANVRQNLCVALNTRPRRHFTIICADRPPVSGILSQNLPQVPESINSHSLICLGGKVVCVDLWWITKRRRSNRYVATGHWCNYRSRKRYIRFIRKRRVVRRRSIRIEDRLI